MVPMSYKDKKYNKKRLYNYNIIITVCNRNITLRKICVMIIHKIILCMYVNCLE